MSPQRFLCGFMLVSVVPDFPLTSKHFSELNLFCHIVRNRKRSLLLIIYFVTGHIIKLPYFFYFSGLRAIFDSLTFCELVFPETLIM